MIYLFQKLGGYAQLFTGSVKECPGSDFIEITREKSEIYFKIQHRSKNVICEYLIYNPESLQLLLTLSGISEHYFDKTEDHALWIYGENPEIFESILSSSDKSVLKQINTKYVKQICSLTPRIVEIRNDLQLCSQ